MRSAKTVRAEIRKLEEELESYKSKLIGDDLTISVSKNGIYEIKEDGEAIELYGREIVAAYEFYKDNGGIE